MTCCCVQKRRTGVFGLKGVTFLSEEKYALLECLSVEIGMQTHSNCMKDKNSYIFHI